MEKRMKLSFSVSSKAKPPKPIARPAAFSVAAGDSGPVPRFVTMFDPSQTLTPAAPSLVIPPLPNSRKPTEASTADSPAFVLDASDNPSSSVRYGLTVRNMEAKRKLAPADAAREPPPYGPSGDLMLRQFKQDMAILPDIQGTDEYDEVPVEGFGAALLAGYGWKEGNPIGKNKTKADAKVVERGRRFGTHGIGFDPSKKTTTRSRRSIPAGKENMIAKKERRNATEESDSIVTSAVRRSVRDYNSP